MTIRGPRGDLSDRELQVLRLIAEGHDRPSIANRLGIGQATVRSHANRIYGELGANSAAHAVHLAWQAGILGPHPAGEGRTTVAPPSAPLYLVRSLEHNIWWRRGGCGFTADVSAAGRFTLAQARNACSRRSWKSPVRPPEVYVLAPECWTVHVYGDDTARHMDVLLSRATQIAIAERAATGCTRRVAS